MANRFPVVANSDIRRLEELPSADNLNLSGSGIYDGVGVGTAGQQLYSTGTGVEWDDQPPEYDTLYSISAADGTAGKKIIRLTASGSGSGNDDVTLVAGTNVSLSRSNDEITINSSFTDTDTITRVRGNTSGTYEDGDITLLPQGSVFISQTGNNITIGATDTNTITRLRGTSSGVYTFGDLTITGTNATTVSQTGSTITIDSLNTVTRIKGFGGDDFLTGDVTLKAAGATTVAQVGSEITFTSVNTTYGLNASSVNTTTKRIRLAGSDSTTHDVNLIGGAGIALSVASNNITISADSTTLSLDTLSDVVVSGAVSGQVLRHNGTNFINAQLSYADLSNRPSLATVATSGSYADLLNKPTLVTDASALTDTTGRFFSGDYEDLTNAPALSQLAISAAWSDILNKPNFATVATSGSYSDLSNKPNLATVATSGSYADLTNKPTIPPAQDYNISIQKPAANVLFRLNESISNLNDDIVLSPGAGIAITNPDNNTVQIESTLTGVPTGVVLAGTGITFEGATVNTFKTILSVTDPTANRTLTLPNATGTLIIDSTNKTYTINSTEVDTRFYETKFGLVGSNTGGDSYSVVAACGGMTATTDAAAGGAQGVSIPALKISPPPAVHIGSTAPVWAKDGDLWYDAATGILKIFDEDLFPTPAFTVDYFQAVDQGAQRFFADNTSLTIPGTGLFVVAPGIPAGANITSIFNGAGSSVGWFNLNTTVTTNIPHNATIRIYNSDPGFNVLNAWRTLYTPIPLAKTLQSRTTTQITTASLLPEGGENVIFTGFKSYAVLKVETSVPAWVTLYTSTATRSNDASRPQGTTPNANSGVVSDVVTTNSSPVSITPGTFGFTDDATTNIHARIVNKSGSDQPVTVTLTLLKLED
jgi:hypothetical protein